MHTRKINSMPHPHRVALASTIERWPATRSTGCIKMVQLGTSATAGPFSMKASDVWIWSRVARTQKVRKSTPNRMRGNGLPCFLAVAVGVGDAIRRPPFAGGVDRRGYNEHSRAVLLMEAQVERPCRISGKGETRPCTHNEHDAYR